MRILLALLIIIAQQGITNQEIYSQIKGMSSFEMENLFGEESLKSLGSADPFSKSDGTSIGDIVDPENYFIGPGDVLAIQILSISPTPQFIIISPENSILLPRIGAVNLSGLKLSQAKDSILKKINQWNPSSISFVSLYKPRNVIVQVEGNVKFPGTYTFPASYKVSTALSVADNKQGSKNLTIPLVSALSDYNERIAQKEKYSSISGLPSENLYSLRNIRLLRSKGRSLSVDLLKAKALSDNSYDPFIKEGDRIYVPFEPVDYPKIAITGEVLKPGSYPLKDGDNIELLIKFSYGFTDAADLDNVHIVINSSVKQKIDINKDDFSVNSHIKLLPGNNVLVGSKVIKIVEKTGVVSVTGKVLFPDVYSIEPGKTRIKEIIDKAGGFTEGAYLPLAQIIRKSKMPEFSTNMNKVIFDNFQYSDLTPDDSIRFKIDMINRNSNVSIDFEKLYHENDESQNVLLSDEDLIIIPQKPVSVFVLGQVNNPGFVEFSPNKTLDWYVQKAGGYANGAEKSRARIIRGKNKVWVEPDDDVFVFAGDEIYVPRPPDLPPGVELQTWGLVVATLGSLAAVLNIILISLNR